MKKNITEIIFILDRSGSMCNVTKDTIGGYNQFILEQRAAEGEARLTTILFDNHYEILHQGVDIKKVAPLTSKEYFARGNTALLDAVGRTVLDAKSRINEIDEEEKPTKVIVVITTDGLENASREFTYLKVKQLITHQQEKHGWEILFLGANIDAAKEADLMGIQRQRSSNYQASSIGTANLFQAVSGSVLSFRSNGKIGDDWKNGLESEKNKSSKS